MSLFLKIRVVERIKITLFNNFILNCIDKCKQFKCENQKADDTPVCGSDGITYSNECILKYESCNASLNLTIVHKGNCKSLQSNIIIFIIDLIIYSPIPNLL